MPLTTSLSYCIFAACLLIGCAARADDTPVLSQLSAQPVAAYSLRLLSKTYTGKAIQVRRSSDNTATDIGFVEGNLDTAALTAFCGKSDGFVTTWYDQSASGNNAVQSAEANQPLIVHAGAVYQDKGHPAVQFVAAKGNFLDSTAGVTIDNASSVDVVAQNDATDMTSSACLLTQTFPGVGNIGFSVRCTGPDTLEYGVISASFFSSTTTALPERNPFVFTGVYGASLVTSWLNGVANAATKGPATSASAEKLRIGRRWDLENYWDGSVQEVLVFSTALSDPDRTALENDQFKFYRIDKDPTATFLATPSTISFADEKMSVWHGFKCHNVVVDGCGGFVAEPKNPLPGKPWAWVMEFPDAFPRECSELGLLEKGFYVAHLSVGNTFGCSDAVQHLQKFYETVTGKGLNAKVVLIAISRGGLYAYHWATLNPDKVSVIYGDAAVCDIKSWPGGKGKGVGSPGDWQALIANYHFKDEAEALAYQQNPIDVLKPLADAKVPVIHLVGDTDDVVPPDENGLLLAAKYKALGGDITIIHKPGVGHHPHGLPDPTPVIDFIMAHATPAAP